VSRASVTVDGETIATIATGLLVFVGVTHDDDDACADRLAQKVRALRVFPDADGRMNEPLGERDVLAVSQFTLYADTRRGTRPGFADAAAPAHAQAMYARFCAALGAQTGRFGAHMAVELVDDGPVTVMLEAATGAGA
jgi:D-tyrosyl-tRNA(Tyr) deacylase